MEHVAGRMGLDNTGRLFDAPSSSRFVNRTRELARLWGNLDEALKGNLRIVELSGEPGIGKSRLLDEFANRARRMQIQVAKSVCEQDSRVGFEPWRQVFRIWMSERDHDEIREILDIDLPTIAQLVPELLDLPDIQAERKYSDPQQERLRLFAAMTGWLRRAAERSPLVIILDDLQMADRSSLELLEYLAAEIRSAPCYLSSPTGISTSVVGTRWFRHLPDLRGARGSVAYGSGG